MEIKGFIQNSLLEWEGRISCVLFLPRCNFRCRYCHASRLIDSNLLESIETGQVLAYMEKQKGWLDGAVITGGEPTMHEYELLDLIGEIKKIGLDVMVETNGSNPRWVEKLLKNRRIDAIAMDVKAPLDAESYREVTAADVDPEHIRRSIRLILDSGIEHEFRITVLPGLVGLDEVKAIVPELEGAQTIAIQNFQPEHCLDPALRVVQPFLKEELEDMADAARPFARRVIVRGSDRAVLAGAAS